MNLQGTVMGGQQPVANATMQLYTVGTSGNGSAAVPMLVQPVVTNSAGSFSITGDYTCGNSSAATSAPGAQVYILATGGNPGLSQGANNPALAMMAALGPCSNLSSTTQVFVDEVTTVAAVWVLAPFMSSATQVGASSTNASGIANAFLNANLLADTSHGMAAVLPSNLTTEAGKLYALADALAVCVNSNGTSACLPLFNASVPTGGTMPTDTIGAALNIVRNPGRNVAAVFNSIPGTPVFATTLAVAPNDWTMSLTITGGGLASPTALGIDAQSNVWVVSEAGPLSAFSPQGSPLSQTGFGLSQIDQSYGLAIDTTGNVWVTNYNTPYNKAGAVTKFLGANSGTPGAVVLNGANPGFFDASIRYPYGIAADTNGNIFVANNDSSSATVYSSGGGLVSPSLGANSGINAFPITVALDSAHGFWLADDDNTVAHFDSAGDLLSHSQCCSESYGIAIDAQGDAWVADYLGGTNYQGAFAVVKADGTVLIDSQSTGGQGGVRYPVAVTLDAAQNAWMTNYNSASFSELAGYAGGGALGAAMSPTVGVYGPGGYGLDANLRSPFGEAVDRSGNLWIANAGKAAITMFFGVATPTLTPVQPGPVSP